MRLPQNRNEWGRFALDSSLAVGIPLATYFGLDALKSSIHAGDFPQDFLRDSLEIAQTAGTAYLANRFGTQVTRDDLHSNVLSRIVDGVTVGAGVVGLCKDIAMDSEIVNHTYSFKHDIRDVYDATKNYLFVIPAILTAARNRVRSAF